MANSLEAETPSQSSAGKAKRPVADKGKKEDNGTKFT
jgi:hypothetical protein